MISVSFLSETMYRFCDQRTASVSLYAKEQRLAQVPHLASGGVASV